MLGTNRIADPTMSNWDGGRRSPGVLVDAPLSDELYRLREQHSSLEKTAETTVRKLLEITDESGGVTDADS